VVSEQVIKYLEGNSLLPKCQSAYRVGHSCKAALLHIHSYQIAAADTGKISIMAMLDLTAAFDCVDHVILLRRLHSNFGLAQLIKDWDGTAALRTNVIHCIEDHEMDGLK